MFIDARNLGHLINRRTKDFTDADIQQIAHTYHNWRTGEREYNDVAGFCRVVSVEEVKALNYVLTPGRFVGLPDDEEDFNFAQRFLALKIELEKQISEEDVLNKRISNNLSKIKIDTEV